MSTSIHSFCNFSYQFPAIDGERIVLCGLPVKLRGLGAILHSRTALDILRGGDISCDRRGDLRIVLDIGLAAVDIEPRIVAAALLIQCHMVESHRVVKFGTMLRYGFSMIHITDLLIVLFPANLDLAARDRTVLQIDLSA